MARKPKRRYSRNGASFKKNKKSFAVRRANGTGTVTTLGGKFVCRYWSTDSTGRRRLVSKTANEKLFASLNLDIRLKWESMPENERPPEPDTHTPSTPPTRADAQWALMMLMDGNRVMDREAELRRDAKKLRTIQERRDVEREEEKRIAEEEARKDEEKRKIREAEERDERAIRIADAWPIYEASKKRPDSGARTLGGYRTQYGIFAGWMKENHPDKPRLRDMDPHTAELFLKHLEQTRSRNTRNKFLIFLRCFWRVMRWNPDAQLAIDPWDGIQTLKPKGDVQHHQDFTVDEIRRTAMTIRSDAMKKPLSFLMKPKTGSFILEPGDGQHRQESVLVDLRPELLGALCLAVYSGWRLGDVVTTRWDHIDLVLGTMWTMPRKTADNYEWTVKLTIHPTLRALLMRIPAENRTGYLLPNLADIYLNREPSIITNRFQAAFRAAGIETNADAPEKSGGIRKRVLKGFHSCRHFFKTFLSNRKVNAAIVNYLMAHDQGRTEATYYHENTDAISAAINTLPRIGEFSGCGEGPVDAIETEPTAEHGIISESGADAAEGRFCAFCEAVDGMGAEELGRAAKHLADLIARARAAKED